MSEYKAFIEKCLEGFDENSDPDRVSRSGRRFDEIRTCFLVGEPIETDRLLQERTLEFKAHARAISTELIREVDRSLALLNEFCDAKAKALRFRSGGKVAIALRLESVAEARYRQLPEAWRW